MTNFNKIASKYDVNISMEGLPIRSIINCLDHNGNSSLEIKSLFFQEMINQGILFGPGYVLLSYSHSLSDIKKTLKFVDNSMKIVENAIKTNSVKKSIKGNVMKRVMTF